MLNEKLKNFEMDGVVHATKDKNKIVVYTTTSAVLIFDFSLVIFYKHLFPFCTVKWGSHFHILQFMEQKRAKQKLHFIFSFF